MKIIFWRNGVLGLLVISMVLAVGPVGATPVVQYYWRMGENDPGAVEGGVAVTTLDVVTGAIITNTGGAHYSADVSPVAALHTGSSLSLALTNGAYGIATVVPEIVNNFCLELWAKATSTNGLQCLAYNGNGCCSGWGLYQVDGTNEILFGGITFAGAGVVTPGVWTHLALVCDSDVVTLYTNGVAAGGSTPLAPNYPEGAFSFGANRAGAENFNGYLDEVRVFTFDPGEFTTNLLLLLSPPVTLGTTNFTESATAGEDSVALTTTTTTISWTGTANASWLHLPVTTGIGNATVDFTFDANTSYYPRTGTLTIAGQTVTVTQAGVYTYTVLNYWRMGENDPGAVDGGPAAATLDAVSGVTIATYGRANYSADVAPAATLDTGSSLSLALTNGAYGVAPVLPGIVDDFCLELWAKATSTNGTQCLAYNGTSCCSGWGIYQAGGAYQILFGGISFAGLAPVTPGVWTHLALVCDSSLVTLYTNGVPAGEAVVMQPNDPDGAFSVGANVTGGENFNGYLDEVRVVTFVPGEFSTNLLLLQQVLSVSPSNITESAVAGQDSVFLTTTPTNVAWTATANATWLHLTVTNGTGSATVYFSFDANGSNQPRTGTLTIAGQTVTVTQAALAPAGTPPILTGGILLANGSLQFGFTNTPGASFTVLTSTNLTLPLNQWSVAGAATDLGGGVFQFTTPGPASGAQAFYLVRSP